MNTFMLDPKGYMVIKGTVPPNRRIELEVEASHSITCFLLDSKGVHEFREKVERGKDVRPFSYAGGADVREFREIVQIPFDGDFYLAFDNASRVPVAVHYETSTTAARV